MRTLILCEGKTDAILISYLLQKQSGWKYTREKSLWAINNEEKNDETVNWYKRENDYILICAVGGKTNFGSFFKNKLYQPILHSHIEENIDKIIYIVDKDHDNELGLCTQIIEDLTPCCQDITIGEWKENKFTDSFGKERTIDVLGLIVPNDQEGALENVLLSAISENVYDKNIVDKSTNFVEEIKDQANKYIKNSRLVLKAKLSVVFAILSPQKVFTLIDQLIQEVDWEQYDNIMLLFEKILQL